MRQQFSRYNSRKARQRRFGSGYQGPLDLVPGAVAAYGMRALSADWIGENVIRLRRDSDDAQLDFVAQADGTISVAAVTAWLAGANGFCVTLYDQSGNGKDATMATAGRQPKWVANAQNSRPSLQFMRADEMQLDTSQRVNISGGEISVFFIMNQSGDPTNDVRILFLTGANILENVEDPYWEVRLNWNSDTSQGTYRVEQWATPNNAGSFDVPITDITGGLHLFEAAWKFGSGAATLDGSALGYTGNIDSGGLVGEINEPLSIGSGDVDGGLVNNWDGYIAEEIIYASIVSAPNRAAIRQNIADYYGITLA